MPNSEPNGLSQCHSRRLALFEGGDRLAEFRG